MQGYNGSYGINDDATMEEALAAFADALDEYDAVHGPPMEAAEDEVRLKRPLEPSTASHGHSTDLPLTFQGPSVDLPRPSLRRASSGSAPRAWGTTRSSPRRYDLHMICA